MANESFWAPSSTSPRFPSPVDPTSAPRPLWSWDLLLHVSSALVVQGQADWIGAVQVAVPGGGLKAQRLDVA